MKTDRTLMLKIAAGAAFGLLLLDWVVFEPALHSWSDQSQRIAALRKQVTSGQALLDQEKTLRDQWAAMMRENPPSDNSAAEDAEFKAIARWERDAKVVFTSLTKQKAWEHHGDAKHPDQRYDTLEFTIAINGDQASIGRFLWEMESDAIPVDLKSCDMTTRDPRGTQLALTATFSFLRLPRVQSKS